MTKPDIHEIEARLREGRPPSPPSDLAERLKEEIPERPQVVEFPGESERKTRFKPSFLLAATLAIAFIGGSLAYRVSLESPMKAPAVLETAPTTESAEQGVPEGSARPSERRALEDATVPASAPPQNPRAEEPGSAMRDLASKDARQSRQDEALGEELVRAPMPRLSVTDAIQSAPARPSGKKSEEKKVGDDGSARAGELKAAEQVAPFAPPARLSRPSASRRRIVDDPASVSVEDVITLGRSAPSTGGTAEPNDQAYGDMFFKSHGVNPFIDTEDDNLSTFGLDVDTGSYTLARSYLERGHLPPPEAIRVEEMVNFFDYSDPAPSRGDFAIVAEGAPSPFADGPRYQLLRFSVHAREIEAADRSPATLIFVVDVSGSMNREDRLGLVKQSLGLLLDQLRPDDRVGLVIYGSRGEVVLEPTGDLESIRAALERLYPQGSTNAEEGLVLGYELAERFRRDGAIHRIVLCSDGVANVGRTGPESILGRIGTAAENGIELTAVGFGMGNYNDLLMEQLADRGDGSYAYVDSLDEARRVFVENLTGTLQTVAREAKVQVEFNPDTVSRYRLLGYENRDIADERFRDDTVDAGEIGAGHSVTALYEIKLVEGARKKQDLATVRLRYHSVAADEVIETESSLQVRELATSWDESSPALRLSSLVAEYSEILRESYWARESPLSEVFARAQRLAVEYPGDVDVAEFVTLVGKAMRLQDIRDDRYGEE